MCKVIPGENKTKGIQVLTGRPVTPLTKGIPSLKRVSIVLLLSSHELHFNQNSILLSLHYKSQKNLTNLK